MPELKDLKDIKENIVKLTKEGIFSFIRNILMFASIGVLGFLILNLDYTVELFSANPESVIAGILFLLVLIFEIGRLEAVRNNPKNTKKIIDEYNISQDAKERKKERRHEALIKHRFEIGPLISNELKSLIISLGASRASVIEMHNGTNSLSGVPFIYGDMVYEETDKDIEYTMNEYKDFNMSKFSFITKYFYDESWFGSVDEIEPVDKMLYTRMKFFGTKYFGFIVITGIHSPLGLLTISFKDDNIPPRDEIYKELAIVSQKIARLLDEPAEI